VTLSSPFRFESRSPVFTSPFFLKILFLAVTRSVDFFLHALSPFARPSLRVPVLSNTFCHNIQIGWVFFFPLLTLALRYPNPVLLFFFFFGLGVSCFDVIPRLSAPRRTVLSFDLKTALPSSRHGGSLLCEPSPRGAAFIFGGNSAWSHLWTPSPLFT